MNTTFAIKGLKWPKTLGIYTLMGPVNDLGSWRWYEHRAIIDGKAMSERIKINSQLQPIWESIKSVPIHDA